MTDECCPYCRKPNACATHPSDSAARPDVDDWTMCLYCGGLGRFESLDPVQIRRSTATERAKLSPEERAIVDEAARYVRAYREVERADP